MSDEQHARLNRPPLIDFRDDDVGDAAARWPTPFADEDLDGDALWFEFVEVFL